LDARTAMHGEITKMTMEDRLRMEELKRQIEEGKRARQMLSLRNRLDRYQRRLIREGFAVAEAKGIKVKLIDERGCIGDDNIVARVEVEGSYADPSELIAIAKDNLPSLYRKYVSCEKKYIDLFEKKTR
jgi:hypothetical protein